MDFWKNTLIWLWHPSCLQGWNLILKMPLFKFTILQNRVDPNDDIKNLQYSMFCTDISVQQLSRLKFPVIMITYLGNFLTTYRLSVPSKTLRLSFDVSLYSLNVRAYSFKHKKSVQTEKNVILILKLKKRPTDKLKIIYP